MKFRNLLIIFGVVLIVFLIAWFYAKDRGESTLRNDLVEVDTSKISAMYIYPLINGRKEIKLVKSDGKWMIELNGKLEKTEKNTVQTMLIELDKLRPQRLASNSEEKWERYEVVDSLGTRLKIESDGEIVTDIILGKFDYNQQTRVASNYVRLTDETKVYVVPGYVSMSFNKEADAIRDRSMIYAENTDDWSKITYTYPGDSSFVMTKSEGRWFMNGMITDSISAANYVSSLSRLGGSGFVDNFNPGMMQPQWTIKIEGVNTPAITLEAFENPENNDYVIESGERKGTYFSGTEGSLFTRVFVGPSKFAQMTYN